MIIKVGRGYGHSQFLVVYIQYPVSSIYPSSIYPVCLMAGDGGSYSSVTDLLVWT
jgi:hypothetical protein